MLSLNTSGIKSNMHKSAAASCYSEQHGSAEFRYQLKDILAVEPSEDSLPGDESDSDSGVDNLLDPASPEAIRNSEALHER